MAGRFTPRSAIGLQLLAVVAGGALVVWCNRGLTFAQDEWDFLHDRLTSGSLDAFFIPHNQHLAVLEVILYKGAFFVSGLRHYWPFQLTDLVGHAVCVILLFECVRRRLGGTVGFFVILPVVVLGSAWEDLLLPFDGQFIWAVAFFLGVVLLLDRHDRRADIAICLLLVLSVASDEFGLAAAAGVCVRFLWSREQWRRVWTAIVPIALYGLWYVNYGANAQPAPGFHLSASPTYLLQTATGSLTGLFGVSLEVRQISDNTWLVHVFQFLAICLVGALIYAHFSGRRRLTPTLAMLLTTLVVYWLALTATRGYLHVPYVSHYEYPSAVLIALIGAEFFRGRVIPFRLRVGVMTLFGLAAVLNAALLVHFSNPRRHNAHIIAAEIGAMQLARSPFLDPNFRPDNDPARALSVTASRYFFTVDKLHSSPVPGPAGIAAEPEYARVAADDVLIRALKISPSTYTRLVHRFLLAVVDHTAPTIGIDQATGGRITKSDRCIGYYPISGHEPLLELTLPAVGATISSDGPVQMRLRLFAHSFPRAPLATVSGTVYLGTPEGRALRSWHLQLVPSRPVKVCRP